MAFLSSIGKSGDVAERSPAVISANLKEDMLLQKKMVVLNRSERSVVHQIQVDQKVLYKRFQAKLTRSKLAQARLLGQRDLQRELRARNLGGLNTDIAGNCEDDYAFLKLLEKRPCTSMSPHLSMASNSAGLKRVGTGTTTDGLENGPLMPAGRSASARARYHRQLADDIREKAIPNAANEAVITSTTVRPATSSGARVDEEFLKHQTALKSAQESDLERKVIVIEETTNLDKNENNTADEHSAKDSHDEGDRSDEDGNRKEDNDSDPNKEINGDAEARKKQSVAFVDELNPNIPVLEVVLLPDQPITEEDGSIPHTPISPGQLSRRSSKGADFFKEEKKVDLVSLRLQQAKSLDYTNSVNKFCEDLEELKGNHKQPSVDYYAMRLQLSQEQCVDKSLANVPGTPEDENKRSVGNLFIRSLTVPDIDWNFTT